MPPYTAPHPGPKYAAPWTGVGFPGPGTLAPHRSPTVRFTLPAQEALVGCVRTTASDLLTRWHLADDERDAAVLIVGELAANAATHGRSEMSLCLTLDPGMLYIVVSDHGRPAASRGSSANDDPDEHGRGVGIVHALATRVDLLHDDHGTRVLACLPVTIHRPRAY
ncbi:anti-sigma regulatory factor (Ser/Thr protein kinase) [Streptomyces sp. SLBN-118]|uniref:ATP-binding protein n=1 Tax=Streptomyces sp. SLBN-118 TaxID=2768454 RepID=UPI00116808EA|nr:ATP-binding protein [Streptomyces sp. SLBN-118]TQK51240.1 anti-sigma regulatory factor (Ser/Thr protein kinase) [Streptomyces sp. SLBN-118]